MFQARVPGITCKLSVIPARQISHPGAGLSVPDRQKISASTKAQASVARWTAARQLQILWSWRALLHSVNKKPNRPLGESED